MPLHVNSLLLSKIIVIKLWNMPRVYQECMNQVLSTRRKLPFLIIVGIPLSMSIPHLSSSQK